MNQKAKKATTDRTGFDPIMSAERSAEYLDCSKEHLLRLARRGEISSIKAPGARAHVKFRLSDLNQWVERNQQPARRFA